MHFEHEITSVVFSKYEIYWVNFWENIWTEFSWRRPALIIKNNSFIRWKDIIVIPITSQKINKTYYKFDILIWKSEKNRLSQDSVIKLEQIKTVSKLRIWDYIWNLDEEYKKILEQKIHKLFL
jgi:mRNA interferase MazF